jgi:Mn2+/Fe2+ NRAMP family transporter
MPQIISAHSPPAGVKEPPHTTEGILRELGPGLIVAGAVVGSGELIATTATGAEAGFWLMWLIIIGCVIKVFVQVEMGRYVICTGQTSLAGMSKVPGPRIGPANWVLWFWLATILVSTAQLGGIVGGVGQALAISAPLTENGREYNRIADAKTESHVWMQKLSRDEPVSSELDPAEMDRRIAERKRLLASLEIWQSNRARLAELEKGTKDHLIWAGLIALASTALLVFGRYGFIQAFVTLLVGLFTLMTVVNVILLQLHPSFAMQPAELMSGLSFRLPPKTDGVFPLATALATFGIIGVAAGEMVFYPYWCQEKGYARFVGPNDGSGEWVRRARGWMRVLRWDAFGSMLVYTTSTVAFYILGAAILNRIGLVPKGTDMIRTLGVMYEPVFGETARGIFLIGAVAVLYSTFFVTNASKARMCTDALRLFGLRADTDAARRRWLTVFSVAFPMACFLIYWIVPEPKRLVLAGGVMQGILLPVMACTAIYFRYKFCDSRLLPGRGWDACLWLSGIGMLIAGAWVAVSKVFPALKAFG